ncbi:putative NACHT and WD domain protein [Rosellinia necatrix]|uniref:Putative NACHT and WD domain protein n=1 Tax=Rosellinia necatrix TaxID=77044 RepID=A0A1W2TCT6_ROSNE|nr:putative NACHT and WD domain protein [Rosellinia necatrix]
MHERLSGRFHSMYFLATPHKGSDSARLLKNILQAAASSREYVGELERGSAALQSINDEFEQYSRDVSLWSFYETEKMSIGVFSVLIVDPDSATLGYPGEKQMPMNANHRSICKFETPSDPNYIAVRNALAVTVNAVRESASKVNAQLSHQQRLVLQSSLAVDLSVEEDLNSMNDARLDGTCEWVLRKPGFVNWRDSHSTAAPILWLSGKPGSGKSTLASYIVEYLRGVNAECSYFFFRHSDKTKQQLATCFRSLAFQMAVKSTQIRQRILQLRKEGVQLDSDSAQAVWRSLFLYGIFEVNFPKHYWVIDGLDECSDMERIFEPVLGKLDSKTRLRILIISRETADLKYRFSQLGHERVGIETITISDTLQDIGLLVETKSRAFLVKDDHHRTALVQTILEKATGSFLWASLILEELAASYSEEEMERVLEDIPRDMESLYERTLETMSYTTRGKDLIQATLTWTVCALRPLIVSEFEAALKIHIRGTFPQLERSIATLCGQLVIIDKLNKVQIVHETAKAYLLANTTSEFAVDATRGHTDLARVCLQYLIGEEMKPLRTGRRAPGANLAAKRSAFSSYACHSVFWHVSKADPGDSEVRSLVAQLLSRNILSWIEAIASKDDLVPLIRASKHLQIYYSKCAAENSSVFPEMKSTKGWAIDLIRITAKFSRVLVAYPAAIYSLIPPVCPRESMIKQISTKSRKLSVNGLSNMEWDDRLTSIEYHDGRTVVLCHGDGFFAVGLDNGSIHLYHSNSCREYKILRHGEVIKFLQARQRTDLLASCGRSFVRVWNVRTGSTVFNFQALLRPVAMIFIDSVLLIASARNMIASWDTDSDDTQQTDRPWTNVSGDILPQPCAVTLSGSHRMLAAAYAHSPIILWDLDEDAYYGTTGKKMPNGETSTHMITSMVFNPVPTLELLVASYSDGEMVLLDPFNDTELARVRAGCHALTASPNGRFIAGGAGSGIIHIYEFETLKLIYRVKASELFINKLEFSGDGQRLLDIRGPQCNVWEPVVLLRDDAGDESGDETTASAVETVVTGSRIKISVIILHNEEDVAICGRDDGSVALFSLKTASLTRVMYKHHIPVKFLVWWQKERSIMSTDASGTITARRVGHPTILDTAADTPLFHSRLNTGAAIVQVLQNEDTGRFIISTRESDHLWNMEGREEEVRQHEGHESIRMWAQHPRSREHVVCVDGGTVRVFAWNNWTQIATSRINIDLTGLQLKGVRTHVSTLEKETLLVELSELDGSVGTRGFHLFDIGGLLDENGSSRAPTDNDESPLPATILTPLFEARVSALVPSVAHIIQIDSHGRLLFLDDESWVASVNLQDVAEGLTSYTRHFFVPYEWLLGVRSMPVVISQREVVIARNDDLVVIKGGLDFAETVTVKMLTAPK